MGNTRVPTRPWLLVLVLVVLAGCSPLRPVTLAPTDSPAPAASLSANSRFGDDIQTLRQMAFDYWEDFNSYDPDRVLSYLEADYRGRRESDIRRDIERIKMFRVNLGISEESPPRMIVPGRGEMFLRMHEPLGTRRIRMEFLKVEDAWKIAYAEEVD